LSIPKSIDPDFIKEMETAFNNIFLEDIEPGTKLDANKNRNYHRKYRKNIFLPNNRELKNAVKQSQIEFPGLAINFSLNHESEIVMQLIVSQTERIHSFDIHYDEEQKCIANLNDTK